MMLQHRISPSLTRAKPASAALPALQPRLIGRPALPARVQRRACIAAAIQTTQTSKPAAVAPEAAQKQEPAAAPSLQEKVSSFIRSTAKAAAILGVAFALVSAPRHRHTHTRHVTHPPFPPNSHIRPLHMHVWPNHSHSVSLARCMYMQVLGNVNPALAARSAGRAGGFSAPAPSARSYGGGGGGYSGGRGYSGGYSSPYSSGYSTYRCVCGNNGNPCMTFDLCQVLQCVCVAVTLPVCHNTVCTPTPACFALFISHNLLLRVSLTPLPLLQGPYHCA
jgi:hypothetical protein